MLSPKAVTIRKAVDDGGIALYVPWSHISWIAYYMCTFFTQKRAESWQCCCTGELEAGFVIGPPLPICTTQAQQRKVGSVRSAWGSGLSGHLNSSQLVLRCQYRISWRFDFWICRAWAFKPAPKILLFVISTLGRITAKCASYRVAFDMFSPFCKESRLSLCRKINIVQHESLG